MTTTEAEKIIKDTVKDSIVSFAKATIRKKRNFQILDLLIPKERKARSIVGGLETSLGRTLWEPLAKALAVKNGFSVINSNLESPVNMPANLANTLNNIIADRKGNSPIYSATTSHDEIKRVCQAFVKSPITSFETAPKGFGVDIWIRKDGTDYFFDTKTVQPNVGGYTKFMEQILTWYAYYYSRFPTGNAKARIVFPYNPYPGKNFWDKTIGKGLPLAAKSEGWVENEFWDFCSGLTNTYHLITKSFAYLRINKTLEKELDSILS